MAETVFLGKITAITPVLPTDFLPPNAIAFNQRRQDATRQRIDSLGRTVTFAIDRQWKGAPVKTIRLIDLTPINTCE